MDQPQSSRPVALVTGASGGVGAACAVALSRAVSPCDVVLQYQNNAAKAEAVAETCRQSGVQARILQADLSKPGGTEGLIDGAAGAFGRLDILIHAAGHIVEKPLAFSTPAEFDSLLEVHAISAALLAKHSLRYLRKSSCGRIVMIGSLAGEIGLGNGAAYAVAKGALNGLAKSLALEVARWNATVNVIAPGFVETAMTATHDAERKAQVEKTIPLGRYAKAEEIGALAAFLCSGGAGYITGQTIVVDGGMSLG
jgi:3-oxoacyl-[acyl-carrier protein] reductase